MKKPGSLRTDRVEDVEAFAFRHGISVEKAQDLIDRLGSDCDALEEAALVADEDDDRRDGTV